MESLQQFVESLDSIWQWLGVMLVSAIPFVESYLGAALGVVVGVAVPLAIAAAIVGNWVSMLVMVTFGHKLYHWRGGEQKELSPRKQKFKKYFDKFGIAGVSLVGQTMLPSQITSAAMVSLGAPKNKVIFWQTISIIIWGVAFGVLAHLGVNLLDNK